MDAEPYVIVWEAHDIGDSKTEDLRARRFPSIKVTKTEELNLAFFIQQYLSLQEEHQEAIKAVGKTYKKKFKSLQRNFKGLLLI